MVKKVIATVVLLLSVVLFTPSMVSNASTSALVGQEFVMNYPEPSTSDTQGYVHVLMHRDDTAGAGYYVQTYFWSCFAESDGKFSPCEMQVTIRKNSLEFVPFGSTSNADSAFYVVNSITNNGTYSMKKYSSSQRYTPTFENDIVGYKFSGNALVISDINNSVVPFTVYYAPDKSTQLLMDVIDKLTQMNTQSILDNHSLWMKLIDILESSEDIEEQLVNVTDYLKSIDTELKDQGLVLDEIFARAKTIISEQRKTNTWLEKIYNYFAESKEQEKQEITTQGGNSVSQGSDSIQNSGQGFGDSLGGLVSSMSYSGTECSWTFPEVRMPAISGVMDEIVLIEEQPIDFGMWVDAIPSNILLLIRSVLTGALIIYCFKELYGTISYVLTLKGSGVNE